MPKKKHIQTKAEIEAGEKNLLEWKQDHPEGGALTHGRYSSTIRKKYSDRRTSEGKHLAQIMKGLREDLGGNGNIPMGAQIILDSIKSKIVVILQIGKYVDRQIDIINPDTGELLPCLGRSFTTYTESLRRDLEALTTMVAKKPSKTLDLNEYLRQNYPEEGKKE